MRRRKELPLSIRNPVLPGWHPDPSICRVDDEYYLVTSSFAFYPGLPIHKSTDLQSWELAGHALIGSSWLPLDDVAPSFGIWAATIRHARGRFYIVFTVAGDGAPSGLYVTTAEAAEGPWSAPRLLDGEGIDPSLFFDDDGRAYVTAARDCLCDEGQGPGEIWLREFDTASLSLRGPTHILWHGAMGGAWVEAPHIHKHGSTYHLIAAEGGTERNHSVTSARAERPTGPYRTDPRSPLLTHRHLGDDVSVHNVGHADLVDTPDGRSFAVALAVRTVDGHHTLGRETFVVPVEWTGDGPVFRAEGLQHVASTAPSEAPEWMSLRGPAAAARRGPDWSLARRPHDLSDAGVPAFVGIRQDHHWCVLSATVDGLTAGRGTIGIVATQTGSASLALTIDAALTVRATWTSMGSTTVLGELPVDGVVRLRIYATDRQYTAAVECGHYRTILGRIPHSHLSSETVGGFVGVMLGLVNVGEVDAEEVIFRQVTYERGIEAVALIDGDRLVDSTSDSSIVRVH